MISIRIYGKGNSPATTSAIIFFVSFLFTIFVGHASGEYESNIRGNFASRSLDGNGNRLCKGPNCAEEESDVSGAMWFGPRLGRRRRSDEKAEGFNDEQIKKIADALKAVPWTIVSVQGVKRHANQYTPRLGRESGEEWLQKLLMDDNIRLGRLFESDDLMDERALLDPTASPPPTPRLGRHSPFTPSPRLGRRLRALLENL